MPKEEWAERDKVQNNPETPFFLFDKDILKENASKYLSRKFYLNYSIKSCSHLGVLQEVEPFVDGFTVTSAKDLDHVRKISKKNIHYVSPMIREKEIKAVNLKGNSISFNSLESLKRLKKHLGKGIKIFIRANPELSFLNDNRYNPCRPYSKLGVPLMDIIQYFDTAPPASDIYGIHFHTNCQSRKPKELVQTFAHIERLLKKYLGSFKEINMGGGYLYSDELVKTINTIQKNWHQKYGLLLRMEPSFDISNSAGFLCSTVVDIFRSGGKKIAILDTAINHLPETFEYGDSPEVFKPQIKGNAHSYLLAGATCLAGDIFGEYSFSNPLKVGHLITFKNVGAYSLVRANAFNGIPIPKTYIGFINNAIEKDSTVISLQIPVEPLKYFNEGLEYQQRE